MTDAVVIERAGVSGFSDQDEAEVARLNRAWLEGYGLFEERDRKHLEQARESILGAGGEIFFAKQGASVFGTCAAVELGGARVELLKLTVAPEAQGKGIGRRLTEAAMDWARDRGARRIVLLSSTKLEAALHLYERMGFRRCPMPEDPGYETADVYMELDL